MINDLNNFNSSSYNINNTDRFSPKQNSPRLNDTSNTISFASLNVRGVNDTCKFDDIIDDLIVETFFVLANRSPNLSLITSMTLGKAILKSLSWAILTPTLPYTSIPLSKDVLLQHFSL